MIIGRIIEVLRQHKYVEQQKISDSAIVPAREAREMLYALYKDKWVNYYEVSKSSSSGSNAFNPASTVYLWYYNNADGYNSSCNNTLISNIYMILYNMKARYVLCYFMNCKVYPYIHIYIIYYYY